MSPSKNMPRFSPVNKPYWLQHVCEENYALLWRIFPDLGHWTSAGAQVSIPLGAYSVARLVERTPYTLILDLAQADTHPADRAPTLKVRVFLDLQIAEVLIQDHPVCADSGHLQAVLDAKWRSNYFLRCWLEYCLTRPSRSPVT